MPEAEIVDAGQEQIAEELFRADIFCGHAKVPVDWDGVVRQGRLAVDSVVRRRHGPLPGALGDRVGHRGHQRLGRAGRSGGRTHDRADDGLVPQPAHVLPRPAEEGVHPPPHPRPDSQHGGHRGPGRQSAGGWPKCSAPSRPASWPPTCFRSTSRSASRRFGRPIGWTICWPRWISSCCACR